MSKRLLLMEALPVGFQPGPDETLVALTPQVCLALEEKGLAYQTPPDAGTEEELRQRQAAYFQEQIVWLQQLNRALLERVPELRSLAVPPSFLYGYRLKTLLDDCFIRATECAILLEGVEAPVTFHGADGIYAGALSCLCRARGIPYQAHLTGAIAADTPRHRHLRAIHRLLRRGFRLCRGWAAAGASAGPTRLTLLFLETDPHLTALLHAALRSRHRCLVWEGTGLRDFSKGGRLVFKTPPATAPSKSWDAHAQELFGKDSPLWDWIRQRLGPPMEDLVAGPLKEWVRTELARMLPLAEGLRRFYRREGVDFVLTPALISTVHAAAVAACESEGKPQSVLIAHGDGAEVKPAWDLFELAPYQHYFVSDLEFAAYFNERRSACPFATAQVHIGSDRWSRYTQLRRKPGWTFDHREGRLSLKWNRPPRPVPPGKPIVVYPLCQPETDARYLNPLGYSETGYLRLARHLLKVFSEFPEYTFVVKLFPPQTAETSTLAKTLARLEARNILVSSAPFVRWLAWADRVLLDWPSTPLYETALAGVPLHLLLPTRECPIRPAALEKFKGHWTPFTTAEEAGQAARRFLKEPAPKPAHLQPQGEAILPQLVRMRRDSILIAAPWALKNTASLRGVRWAYLGIRVKTRTALEARLGKGSRLALAEPLQEAADRLRKPFLDFVAEVGRCQENLLAWWSSRFSWRMWTASDLFRLTLYLSLAERWVQEAQAARRSLLLVVEDPWLLRQLRENLAGQGGIGFLGESSLRNEKLKALLAGGARRVKWLGQTLWDFWNQWRVWPRQPRPPVQEPSAALFSIPLPGSLKGQRGWQDPHLPQMDRWLAEAGLRVFRFCPPDSSRGWERALAQRADDFHPLILRATPAAIWRSLTAHWRPRWPRVMKVANLAVGQLALREAWLETGRAAVCSYRLFHECLQNQLAEGNWRWLVFFYENQPWEKLAVLCARQRGIRVVGLQTAILSPEYLPYLLGRAEVQEMPLPDVIGTSGPYAHRLLSEWGIPPKRLRLVGAIRYPALAESATPNRNGSAHPTARSEVLVALPIHRPMAEHLLHALKAAFPDGGVSDGLRLHIRPHPLCPIPPSRIPLPADRIPSQFGTVQEALKTCGLVLFTGSTVGFEALHFGRPVLRYRPDGFPDVDSVYGPTVPVCGDCDLRLKLLQLVREGVCPRQAEAARQRVSELFSPWEPLTFREIFQSDKMPSLT